MQDIGDRKRYGGAGLGSQGCKEEEEEEDVMVEELMLCKHSGANVFFFYHLY